MREGKIIQTHSCVEGVKVNKESKRKQTFTLNKSNVTKQKKNKKHTHYSLFTYCNKIVPLYPVTVSDESKTNKQRNHDELICYGYCF